MWRGIVRQINYLEWLLIIQLHSKRRQVRAQMIKATLNLFTKKYSIVKCKIRWSRTLLTHSELNLAEVPLVSSNIHQSEETRPKSSWNRIFSQAQSKNSHQTLRKNCQINSQFRRDRVNSLQLLVKEIGLKNQSSQICEQCHRITL